MKRMIKKTVIVLLIFMCVLPIFAYVSIVVTNNQLADKIEKSLTEYPMPANTELVDSISIAGRLTGNGNGMQYMGAILVKSDLNKEELREYYGTDFDYIEVRKQDTANVDFIHPRNYCFQGFVETNKDSYYSIACWDSNREVFFGNFIGKLLDFDMRGH